MRAEICAIIKNEARYIAEWLEYHFILGIDHVTLYDNGSEDEIHEVCRSFRNLTVISWPERGCQQKTAYQHYIRRSRSPDLWAAFIDADEFIFDATQKGIKNLIAALPSGITGLEMPWIIFDTNMHRERPNGLVLENYTRAHSVAPQRNVKTICRVVSVDADNFICPHRFSYLPGCHAIEMPVSELPLFHYMLRSLEDVRLKVTRGDVWSSETERKRLADVDRAVKSILDKYDKADREEHRMLALAPTVRARLQRRGIAI